MEPAGAARGRGRCAAPRNRRRAERASARMAAPRPSSSSCSALAAPQACARQPAAPSRPPPATEFLAPPPQWLWAAAAASFTGYAILYRLSADASKVRSCLRTTQHTQPHTCVCNRQHINTLAAASQPPIGSCPPPRAAHGTQHVTPVTIPTAAHSNAVTFAAHAKHSSPASKRYSQRYLPSYKKLSADKQVDWNTR